MSDGLSADITEFSLALKYEGKNLKHNNGSVVEKDVLGLGRKIGEALVNELNKMGATFFTVYIVENCEEEFYKSIGFKHNSGHLVYYIEKRPYVLKSV